MARDHEMRVTFLGMHAAAAGLALQERRWFHISKASASRLAKYEDLKQACEAQECEQILCVPVLPQLPSGHVGRAGRAQPPRSAFGVLTLGFDNSVSVDARLLTSTFLLAHLMAQDLIRQAPAMLMRVQSMPAVPRSPSKRPPDTPGGGSSAGRRLGGSLTGPSFPAKRMREPASFANGVYRPEIKPTHPPTSESSQQVSAPVKRQMFAPLPYRAVARCPGDPAPPWHAYKG
ncbi:hypothetical protein CVIRNUC_000065 [Coccomyxa viridis]|uniref:Uncharacterized protein n=1 Tax=Coccomyxa viridis TaxID=1274662 RepID=A0AAV1HPT6_9CHLO|nr:hypothetical protein CVIRNUC_000065 [Coccomyxa viridis]